MATVGELIALALKDAGVTGTGQTASGIDTSDALTTLADMLALWQVDGLLVYAQKVASLTLTGASSYTIGTGGVLSMGRPTGIDAAYWRDTAGIETPITVYQTLADYQAIPDKAQQGLPATVHYEPSYPLGTLYVWPLASSGSLKLVTRVQLPGATELTAELVIPPEYREVIRWSLVERLSVTFQTPLRPDVAALARSGRKTLKRSNTRVPLAQMPDHLFGRC